VLYYNKLYIENSDSTAPLINGEFYNDLVKSMVHYIFPKLQNLLHWQLFQCVQVLKKD